MPFHKFKFYDILTISQSTQKSFISISLFNNDPNICPTQRNIFFPNPWKSYPKKIFMPMKNNAQTSKQNFHTHQNRVYSIMSTHQILMISYLFKKSSQNSSNNAKLHQSPILSKLDNIKQQFKNAQKKMTT